MKKFILFGAYYYYPNGGCDDIIGNFETYTECINAIDNIEYTRDWYQILDIETGSIENITGGH